MLAMPLWRALSPPILSALAAMAMLSHSSARAGDARVDTSGSDSSFANKHIGRSGVPTPQPMGVMINGRPATEQALVVVVGRTLYMRLADFENVGLLPRNLRTALVVSGQDYVALSAIPGLEASVVESGGVLDIKASPAVFSAVRFERSSRTAKLDEIVPAAFIGYDLAFSRWRGENAAFAFLDAGVSGSWGLFGGTVALQSEGSGAVRLDNYFQRDWPEERVRLMIGDTVTRGTEWSAPARFAGIRVGTDFSLQPAFLAFPIPTLTDAATLPSSIELISAGSSQTLSVQPGTFAIDYQPVLSGAGEVTMMITDINGLSRQITRSFYTSPSLLQPGLVEFSAEGGVTRENYGLSSFDYGTPFAAGFLRFGLNRTLTVSGRVEVSPDIQMGGFGIGWVLSPIGEFGLAAAVSHSPWGNGTRWRAQFQRIAPTHAFTFSYQSDNGQFAQIGDARIGGRLASMSRRELAVAGSLTLGHVGHIILGHAESQTVAGQSFRMTTFTLTGDIGSAFYNIGLRHNGFGERTDKGAFVSISMPLGVRSSASLRVDDQRTAAMVGLAPPNGIGTGFQFAAGYDKIADQPIVDISTLIRTTAGEIELAGGRNSSGQGIRLSARGAVTAVGGKLVATPRLDNAFALIELESEEDVMLYFENRPVVAKGGAGKTALLTGLQPYAENQIAIDVSSLPITADVEVAEKLVVPGFRQAVRVDFGGGVRTAVTVKLVDGKGLPLPPGLDVQTGSAHVGITGYEGLAFLPDLQSGEVLVVSSPGFRCEAQIPGSPIIDEKRQLGPVACLQPSELGTIR